MDEVLRSFLTVSINSLQSPGLIIPWAMSDSTSGRIEKGKCMKPGEQAFSSKDIWSGRHAFS